jgi:hypothetical protein
MRRFKESNRKGKKGLIVKGYQIMNKKKTNASLKPIATKTRIESNQLKKDFRIYHLNRKTNCTLN